MTIFADHLARRRAGAHAPQILQTVWGYRERRARRRSSITSSTHKKWRHSEKPAEDKLYDARSSLRRKGSGSDQYPTAITEDQAGPSGRHKLWSQYRVRRSLRQSALSGRRFSPSAYVRRRTAVLASLARTLVERLTGGLMCRGGRWAPPLRDRKFARLSAGGTWIRNFRTAALGRGHHYSEGGK